MMSRNSRHTCKYFYRTLGWFVHHCEFRQLLICTQNVTYEGQIKFGMEKILYGPCGRIISVTYGFLVVKKKAKCYRFNAKERLEISMLFSREEG